MARRPVRQGSVTRRAVMRSLGGTALGGAALAGTMLTDRSVPRAGAVPGQELVGTWISEIGGASTPSLIVIVVYTTDGAVIGTHGQHTLRSPFLGSWQRIGEREFLVISYSVTFDQQDRVTGTVRIRAKITVDESGQELTSENIREAFDVSGALISRTEGIGRARRVAPLPLD